MLRTRTVVPTPLALFVNERLGQLQITQADFCRVNTFDQGLLSKIQNSVVTNLSLESILRLAAGLEVSPREILILLGRTDLHELIFRSYEPEISEIVEERLNNQYRPAAGIGRSSPQSPVSSQ